MLGKPEIVISTLYISRGIRKKRNAYNCDGLICLILATGNFDKEKSRNFENSNLL